MPNIYILNVENVLRATQTRVFFHPAVYQVGCTEAGKKERRRKEFILFEKSVHIQRRRGYSLFPFIFNTYFLLYSKYVTISMRGSLIPIAIYIVKDL